MNYIEQNAPYERVLDFGCGSGVMLPFLCGISARVTAMDIDLLPFEQISRLQPFPANLEVHDAREVTLKDLPKASLDLIVATDVLEHVDDLPGTLSEHGSTASAPADRSSSPARLKTSFTKLGANWPARNTPAITTSAAFPKCGNC